MYTFVHASLPDANVTYCGIRGRGNAVTSVGANGSTSVLDCGSGNMGRRTTGIPVSKMSNLMDFYLIQWKYHEFTRLS